VLLVVNLHQFFWVDFERRFKFHRAIEIFGRKLVLDQGDPNVVGHPGFYLAQKIFDAVRVAEDLPGAFFLFVFLGFVNKLESSFVKDKKMLLGLLIVVACHEVNPVNIVIGIFAVD
jgi:hypothetical protein